MNDLQNQLKNRPLKRELGLFDAVLMGLGSILGTGIFVSIGLAAGVAGPSVIFAIVVAAMVAACNALSSAQLAAAHPVSGGTYEYGYQFLTPSLGFTAGWMFLWAKSASAATAALGFAGYISALTGNETIPHVLLATLTVISFTAIVLSGIRRSSRINITIVSITILSLIVFVITAAWFHWTNETADVLLPFFRGDTFGPKAHNLFHAGALMFVAFTGYGRIATLAEEVEHPQRTIPRAILATLIVSALLYVLVAYTAIRAVGADFLSHAAKNSAAPLELAAREFGFPFVPWLVTIGAVAAMLGVLLNLILGLSRVLLAMGRRRDIPNAFAQLDREEKTPWIAVLATGILIAAITGLGSVKTTWSFSAFTVLIYYAITNASALALPIHQQLFPKWIAALGLISCLFLAFWVEWYFWLIGLILILIGLIWKYLWNSLTHGVYE